MKRPSPAVGIATVWACGVAGAFQIGKTAPALPGLMDQFNLSLTASSWIISAFSLLAVFLGIFAGRFGDIRGYRNSLCLGLALITVASVAGSVTFSTSVLIATRVAEGLGFLLVMGSAPSLMHRIAGPQKSSVAMGIWGTFMPVGTAAALLVGPTIIEFGDWRLLWQVSAFLAFSALIAAYLLLPSEAPRGGRLFNAAELLLVLRKRSILLAGFCFCLYSAIFVSVVGFIPLWLTQVNQLSLQYASFGAALFALCNILGNLAGGWLIHRGFLPAHLIVFSGISLGLLAIPMFVVTDIAAVPVLATMAHGALGGLVPASVFALLATQSPRPDLIGTSSGLTMNLLNIGQLFGPPILALTVSSMGSWSWAPLMLTTFGAGLAATGLWLAREVARGSTPAAV